MTENIEKRNNPLELAVGRYIDAPPSTVYKVWTERLTATLKQHEQMGFIGGWTTVANQLAELAEAAVRA